MHRFKRLFKRTSSKIIAWSIVLFAAIYSVALVFNVKAEELTENDMETYRASYAELQFLDARRIEDSSTSERVVLDYGSGNIVTVEGTDLIYGYHSVEHIDEIWGNFTETSYYVYALGDVEVTAVPTDGYTGIMRLNGTDGNEVPVSLNFENLSAGSSYSMFGEFDDGLYRISFEGAGVVGNDATYQIDETEIVLHVNGEDVSEGLLVVAHDDIDNVSFQLDQNFDPETMRIEVKGDYGFRQDLEVDANNVATLQGINLPKGWLILNIYIPGNNEDPNNPNNDFEIFIDGILGFNDDVATVYYNDSNVDLIFAGGQSFEDRYIIDRGELDNLTITVSNGFDTENMRLVLHGNDDYSQELAINNGVATLQGLNLPDWVHLSIEGNNPNPGPGPGPGPGQNGNIQAQVIITGGEGGYNIDRYYYNEETGQDELEQEYISYSQTFMGAEVAINDSNLAYPFPEFENEEQYPIRSVANIGYNGEENAETITLRFSTLWHQQYYDVIKINGVNYRVSDYFDYNDRDLWLGTFENMHIEFAVPNVAKAEDNIYNVEVKIRDDGPRYISAFSWTSDPAQEWEIEWDEETGMPVFDDNGDPVYRLDEEGNRIPGKNFIGHSRLEFVKATYTVAGHNYTITAEDIESNIEHGYFRTEDGYFTYWRAIDVDFDDGEIDMPESGVVTMRVIPEYGYQVINVNVDEINEDGEFTTTNDGVGEFTVQLHGGGGYFKADVVPVDDEVKSESSKVDSGTIDLGNVLDGGTAQLRVHDIELPANKVAGFEDAAGEFTIANYLDIDLYQVFYRGTEDSDNTWDNKIDELDNEATISIVLADGINAEEIAIVHNIHDGDQYEIIQPTSYDEATRTLTFRSNSFSNYAIAYKNGTVVERQEIERVDITVDKSGVKVGTVLSSAIFNGNSTSTEGVTIAAQAWVEIETGNVYTNNEAFVSETPLTEFIAGKSYAFGVALVPDDDYRFTNNTQVYINGSLADTDFDGGIFIALENGSIYLGESSEEEPSNETVEVVAKNEASQAASEAAEKVIEKVVNDESVSELTPELVSTLKAAVTNGDVISVELSTEKMNKEDVSEADLKLIQEKLEDLEAVIGYFDVDVNVFVNNVAVGQLTKLTEPINVTLNIKDLIEKLPAVAEGYTRVYKVLRIHNGVSTILDATLDANGNLVFATDEFSTYTVTYTDVANAPTPSTGDNIMLYVSLLLISGAALAACGLYFKKNTKHN